MRKPHFCVAALFAAASLFASGTVTVEPADNGKALSNPGMGWVMHYYDNGPRYGTTIKTGDDLGWFPGCSVVYLRLPWAHLEPEEGKFTWGPLEFAAQTAEKAGIPFYFRIMCVCHFILYFLNKFTNR